MSIVEFLSQPLWQRLGLTLVHFLWQGLAVAVLVGVLVRVLRVNHGNARYAAYLLAFIAMMVCPVVTFTVIDIPISPNTKLVTGAEFPQVVDNVSYTVLPAGDILPEAETSSPAIPKLADSIPLGQRISGWLNVSMPWVLVTWMVGVVVLSVRLLMGFVGVYRWRHHLEPLPERLAQRIASLSEGLCMRGFSRVFISPTVLQAMAVGYLRPMILLPAAMVTQMQPEMLEAVIAHELAHIRRLDLWVNLAQRVTETLLFYHPAVWWLSNCLRSERELCCDELAVKATGERITYASTLESVGRARFMAKRPVLAAGLGQDNKPTLSRVRHILGLTPTQHNCPFWLAGVIAVLFLAALVIPTTLALTSRANEQADIQEKNNQKELSKFKRTLPNGVTVELVGLFCGVEEDKRVWWQADGTELPKDSFQRYDERIKPMVWNDIPERRLLYGYVFTSLPSKDVELISDVSEGTRWHTGFADAKGTVRIGYAYSHTIEQQENPPDIGGIKIAAAAGEGEQFESKVDSGSVQDMHILENGTNVIVSGPREYQGYDEKRVDVIVTASDIHVEVSYELENGDIQEADRVGVMGGPSIDSFYGTQRPLHQHSFRVFDPWDRITKFIVNCRKYELVTFKNVALRPGVKTDVQVDVLRPGAGKGEQERPANGIRAVPAITKTAKSIIQIDLMTVEVVSGRQMDWETAVELKNILGDKVALDDPAPPSKKSALAAGALLRKAVAASDVVEGASGRNKRVTKEELKAVVETLVSRGYLKILMNPSLQVVSGKTGKVKSAKASSTSTTEDSFEVTARVLDDGYIELQTRVVLDEKSTPADQNSLLLVTKRELSGTFRIGSGGSCIAGGIEKSVKRPVVGDNPETLEYRTTEELVVLTATIIAAPSNPQPKADVQVERENRIEKLDIETLLSKVRRALQPSDNMRVSWQFETAEPFGWGTTKSPHTVIEYSATISGFKSRLEGLQKTYTSKASEDPYDIRRKTYVFDGKQCRNLEERIKGGNTTNIGWVKPQNVTVELLYQELFACILPLHNKDKLNEYELSLADSPSPGIYVMKIIGPQGDIPYQITIDGSRGFNIINTQWFGAKNRKTLEDTTVLRQYDDGIWYPAERRRMRYYPNGTHKLEHIQTFSKLELDVKVPEETFELEFSPHTIVQGATPGALVIVSDTDTSGKELDVQAAEREARIAAKRLRWLDIKKGGGTKWGSDEWMKEPGYYKELGTEELAEECFSRATFGFEMTIYDDPMYGYSSLEIFHNGFAELFKREDMWKGILHVYDFLSLKLNPKSDLRTIVRVSNDLDAFERMYTIPSFREQVKGREAIFLEANLQVLKRYSQYLEDYDPMASGTKGSPGFFGEPCSVARVALMLAKEVAPERYAGIQPALNSVRWTKGQQKVEELKSYINLVIEGLDGIVSIELERVE